MTPSEVKAGMTGYGLSVFQGSNIEKFNITVIGVVKKVLSGRDAILAQTFGPGDGEKQCYSRHVRQPLLHKRKDNRCRLVWL